MQSKHKKLTLTADLMEECRNYIFPVNNIYATITLTVNTIFKMFINTNESRKTM